MMDTSKGMFTYIGQQITQSGNTGQPICDGKSSQKSLAEKNIVFKKLSDFNQNRLKISDIFC